MNTAKLRLITVNAEARKAIMSLSDVEGAARALESLLRPGEVFVTPINPWHLVTQREVPFRSRFRNRG
jgi:hypothetical protein